MNYETFFEDEIILEDEWVRLEPLAEKHYNLLLPIAMEKALWLFTTIQINTAEDFRQYFDTAILERQQKKSYPFAYYNKKIQQYVGCTRYGNIDFTNKKLEIGWTWLAPSMQGTGFNKHCKFLLLSYGFKQLQLNRIELKTSHLNLKSQNAMLKIGAVREGVLRNHMVNQDGTKRHSHFFSFIIEEWAQIQQTIFAEFSKP
jgi:RimJ/RimL family protein N-acetyltransferase